MKIFNNENYTIYSNGNNYVKYLIILINVK